MSALPRPLSTCRKTILKSRDLGRAICMHEHGRPLACTDWAVYVAPYLLLIYSRFLGYPRRYGFQLVQDTLTDAGNTSVKCNPAITEVAVAFGSWEKRPPAQDVVNLRARDTIPDLFQRVDGDIAGFSHPAADAHFLRAHLSGLSEKLLCVAGQMKYMRCRANISKNYSIQAQLQELHEVFWIAFRIFIRVRFLGAMRMSIFGCRSYRHEAACVPENFGDIQTVKGKYKRERRQRHTHREAARRRQWVEDSVCEVQKGKKDGRSALR
ncbi:hypothetical protein EV702DRAFT_1043879 [Suillus placidus]|uniref:Uncharacterized protein n=1 Tax=Suillus placidus TaxID=48579 RepID=A0A9P6ZZW9_9AGAM|nr:hypothetical protein EV702DRAFT_1043879 [Suillus placidus]